MAVNSFNAQNPPVNTKGDLFTFSTIPTKLGVGSNNQVLTADSTTATGLKWATPSSGGMTLLSTTSLAGVTTVTISSISQDYNHLQILVEDFDFNANDKGIGFRFNGDTASNYFQSTSVNNENSGFQTYIDTTSWSSTNEGSMIVCDLPFYTNSSINKLMTTRWIGLSSTGAGWYRFGSSASGFWKGTPAAITSITVFNRTDSTNFDAGSVKIYGVK